LPQQDLLKRTFRLKTFYIQLNQTLSENVKTNFKAKHKLVDNFLLSFTIVNY